MTGNRIFEDAVVDEYAGNLADINQRATGRAKPGDTLRLLAVRFARGSIGKPWPAHDVARLRCVQADGGTRTAASPVLRFWAGSVACGNWRRRRRLIAADSEVVAAGKRRVLNGEPVVDLKYAETKA